MHATLENSPPPAHVAHTSGAYENNGNSKAASGEVHSKEHKVGLASWSTLGPQRLDVEESRAV